MRDLSPMIVINCRDRVRALRKLVAWLELAGHERIVFLDNASTYEPLLEYLEATPHSVIRSSENRGSRALWTGGWALEATRKQGWFVYTDPDIVPIDACPLDAVDVLKEALDRHPEHSKAALGLDLRDLPDDSPLLPWELRLRNPDPNDGWKGRIDDIGNVPLYSTLSDTTFALYRPGASYQLQALRTGFPYLAHHDCPSWTAAELDAEDVFYLEHCEGANTANGAYLPGRITGSSWKDAHLAAT